MRGFLVTRRARLTPEAAGLTSGNGHRRVPGLRHEEVAMLAGVSVDYYIRIERGNLAGVSGSVLDGVAAALQLDDAERAHLHDLTRLANASAPARSRPRQLPAPEVRPQVVRIIDAMTGAAALVVSECRDVLAANALGRALFSPAIAGPQERPANLARFTFLDPAAREFFANWEQAARLLVGNLRTADGRSPCDPGLSLLVEELCASSEDFSRLWAAHDVWRHRNGMKTFLHPVAGDMELAYEVLELPADPGVVIIVYTAEPDTANAEKMERLALWAADDQPAFGGVQDR